MTNTQFKFKQRNPDYFKNYYVKNKAKFDERNKNRPSKRQFYFVLSVDDKNYCFKRKSDITITKTKIDDIDKNNVTFM